MLRNTSGLYAAFKAKDARFDGRFYIGISSTGIYCRPVCRAKQPKEENCTFYATAAAAEQAGYRPCLLCRPELAPGASVTDATANLVYRAARMLEENCGSGQGIGEIAARLGCTDRHLRRAFVAAYQVAPVQYLQTCRLLLAKSLLTDTSLSVLDVAMASGFGSLRRFNDLFKKHYHLTPTSLRKAMPREKSRRGSISLALGYRPPYPWQDMLRFLKGRAIAGVEKVEDGEYMRTVQHTPAEGAPVYGWIRVGHLPKRNVLSVTISDTLLPVLPHALARTRHLFDLHCDPATIYESLRSMNDVRPGLCVMGTRVPGCFDPFEMAVRAVLGQQVSVRAASTLASRIASAYGTPIDTGIAGLTHVFPTADAILALEGRIESHLGPLGVTSTRSRTIRALAQAFKRGDIELGPCLHPETEIRKLTAIAGIGPWTAQYIAMRTMEWTDAFLETDAGIKKALHPFSAQQMLQMAETWRPWRSYATINLWNALNQTSS